MSKDSSGQPQMQAEQPKDEPKLTPARRASPMVLGTGGTADLGYLSEDGDPKFQRPRRDIADL